MSFSIPQILLFIVVYLSGLFLVAYLADRGIIPARITRHPAVYVLSLGVLYGAMATNGVIDLAYRQGYSFLLYYGGAVLMFALSTLLLFPLLRLCRVHQLASLADLLTFRFRSQAAGALVTVMMCAALMPLLALQIQTVADSIQILAGDSGNLAPRQEGLAQLFCITITIFSILFGTRHLSSRQRNAGLVTAIAFESLVKLLAMLGLLAFATYGVFGGIGELQAWLRQNPALIAALQEPMGGAAPRVLLLCFFAGAVCMPHMFHMAFVENHDSRDLRSATWGLPLYLLLLSLPVLPLLWAGIRLGTALPPEYSGLAIGLASQAPAVSVTAFVAGMSAASTTVIVTTLALANMCINHLVLPARLLQIDREQSIYIQLKWLRRSLIAILILAGYTFFAVLDGNTSLIDLAGLAFSGVLQFLPGTLATPYWVSANRKGLLAGLAAGGVTWLFALAIPVITGETPALLERALNLLPGAGESLWFPAILGSLLLNAGMFIIVSLLTGSGAEERVAAEICSMDEPSRPTRHSLALHSAGEFTRELASALGERTATAVVARAMAELHFKERETRPYALRRLRARIEANLSGLLGPAVAHNIIDRCIPFQPGPRSGTEDFQLIERNLDRAQGRFTGLAADLDNLRRHYRQTLDNLPIGVCSVGVDREVLIWNRSMEQITGIAAREVLGSVLDALPGPWRPLLGDFERGDETALLRSEVPDDAGGRHWVSLHKTRTGRDGGSDDTIIIVEDITDFERMEEELLHSERLASIGRLAAGVAHEIGNPVTGIACLAQNLEYETDPGEIQVMAHDILRQTERVTRIVESLVHFAHSGSQQVEGELLPCNLADCVDEAIHLLQLDRLSRPVNFNNRCNRELLVLADSQKLMQVFVNLLRNARDACDDYGEIRIRAQTLGERVQIEVEDNGRGIPADIQGQIFEPFYTTKEPGAGTGLGLAMVFSILEEMGGNVSLTSPVAEGPNPGTCFTLQLRTARYAGDFIA